MKDNDLLKIENSQFGDYEIMGYSVKYNQLIPNGKITLTRTISSVPTQNTLDPYITIIDPIPNQVVYAKITTNDSRFRVGWYQGLTSGYDFATGQPITATSTLPLANEGVYMITSDMVHSGTNYLQLYFATFYGLPIGTYDITIQLFNITDLGVNSLSEFKKTKEYAYINASREVECNNLVQNGNFADKSKWVVDGSYEVSNGIATISGNTTTARFRQAFSSVVNHKYIFVCDILIKEIQNQFYINYGIQHAISTSNNWQRLAYIDTATSQSIYLNFYFYGGTTDPTPYQLKNVMLLDITELEQRLGITISTIADFYQTDLGRAVLGNFYLPYSATNTKVFIPYLPIPKGTRIVSATIPLTFSGKTIKYNQLVQNGNFESTSGWTCAGGAGGETLSVSSNKITVVSPNGFTSKNFVIRNPQQALAGITGHKYLVMTTVKTTGSGAMYMTIQSQYPMSQTVQANTETLIYNILEATTTANLNPRIQTGGAFRIEAGGTIELSKSLMCFDLTQLFGAGNEPTTIDEFYATDLGKLVKAGVYLPYSPTNAEYETIKPTTLTRTGRVDLGTLDWKELNRTTFPQYAGMFYATISDKATDSSNIRNIFSQKYPLKAISGGWANMEDKTLNAYFQSSKDIVIKDTSFANPTDFKNSLAGVYLEYETTTPLQLNAIGEFRNLFVLNGDNRNDNSTRSVDLKNNSMTITSTKDFDSSQASAVRIRMAYSSGRAKIGNSYFAYALIKTTNKDSSSTYKATFADQGTVGTFVDENNSSDLTTRYKKMFTKIKANYNLDLTISLSSYSNIKIGDNIVSKDLVVVDMTSLGLDTLTAQQFYDQFKDQLDNLANDKSGYKLVDTYKNTSGKVNRKLGEVDLGSLTWVAISSGYYANDLSVKYIGNTSSISNVLCQKYQTLSLVGLTNGTLGLSVRGNGTIWIKDSAYTNATDFKNSLAGVKLIYELATPTVEQHASIMLSKAITKVEDSGKIELEIILHN